MNKFLKVLVVVLCAAMLVAGTVAATVAYLSMKTQTVQNTFTVGDINITLTQENKLNSAKMVPGTDYKVDPVVTVKAGSESCYLFIKIEEPTNFNNFLTYAVDTVSAENSDGWTALTGVSGVYYRKVDATTADTEFSVIKNGTITANSNCTKADYTTLKNAGETFNLKFTAYAVQQTGVASETAAWDIAKALDTAQSGS